MKIDLRKFTPAAPALPVYLLHVRGGRVSVPDATYELTRPEMMRLARDLLIALGEAENVIDAANMLKKTAPETLTTICNGWLFRTFDRFEREPWADIPEEQ